ncbi:hypothetical protein [Citrobacter amalonaticus]|uniref:hypothetical protein n=1 Tax=Citrobacter amalonaticus TaxID=35703 RepID=UPI001782BA2C|nr:hypothetical protein [Citrobacter amalonaticus]ELK6624814.1 hypothetical protein [Citrobacter amalonaticus]
MEQNAQAKIQFWNAMRKIIPATGTIATDMGQRNAQYLEGRKDMMQWYADFIASKNQS